MGKLGAVSIAKSETGWGTYEGMLLLYHQIACSWASLSVSDMDLSGRTGSTGCRAAGSSEGSRSTGQEGERRKQRHWTKHAWAWAPPHWGTLKSSSLLSIVNFEALMISFILRLQEEFSMDAKCTILPKVFRHTVVVKSLHILSNNSYNSLFCYNGITGAHNSL